jgi:hypothetical protein
MNHQPVSRERELAQVLTPESPPRVLDEVYRDDEYERLLGVVQRHGPWPTIQAHHFESVDELIATSSGVVPKDHGLTLDAIATANFRGFYGQNSVCFYPEVEDIFYSSRLLDEVRSYWGARYAKPTMMLFNICGPHQSGLNPHLDATTFRGVRYENSPVWLQNVMAKSGLFTDYIVNMAQVITWWYRGEAGTFTYWPDGPLHPPKVLRTPIWNRGVVVQNELMFHRGDPVGSPNERAVDVKHRSLFAYIPDDDAWVVTTDGEVVRRYEPRAIRLLVHWSAEVYRNMDEVRKVMDHTDDLTHERVVDALIADLRQRGVSVEEPSDPLHDESFIHALLSTYRIAPTIDWLEGEIDNRAPTGSRA